MIIAAIDPGVFTGVMIVDFCPDIWGKIIEIGTIKDDSTIVEFCARLELMKQRHQIDLAVIETYDNFGRRFRNASKVREEIRACRDVFPTKIMVKTGQWNPRHFKDGYKRVLAASIYNRSFSNSHSTDASLIMNWFIQFVMSWARYTKIPPENVVRIIAHRFGAIPKRGELTRFFNEIESSVKQPTLALCSNQ